MSFRTGSISVPSVGHVTAYPEVLTRAGANDADIVVALTDTDETNMVACQIAYTLFHTPTKIARIRSAEYMNSTDLFFTGRDPDRRRYQSRAIGL